MYAGEKQGPNDYVLAPTGASRLTPSATRASDLAFQAKYAHRAGIEGTISQGVRGFELRVARYIGLAQTHLQMLATATAINLHRLFDWWEDKPRAKTRVSSFAKLAPAPTVAVPSWGGA